MLGYNFTRRDMDHSRSFGLVLDDRRAVEEARQMYEADFARRAYVPEHGALVVSPFNSRAVLARLIQQARRQLLIYDKRLSDDADAAADREAGPGRGGSARHRQDGSGR